MLPLCMEYGCFMSSISTGMSNGLNQRNWDYKTIALSGSSLFKLPLLLNWFTGSIGYHHVHHLSPLIPNYNLRRCHNENPMFHEVKPITFFSAFESLFLRLWDEKRQMLIRFSEASGAVTSGVRTILMLPTWQPAIIIGYDRLVDTERFNVLNIIEYYQNQIFLASQAFELPVRKLELILIPDNCLK